MMLSDVMMMFKSCWLCV